MSDETLNSVTAALALPGVEDFDGPSTQGGPARKANSPRFVQDKPQRQVYLRNSAMRTVGLIGSLLRAMGGRRARGQLGILTYHRVFPEIAGLPPLLHNVAPHRMREQLLGLKRRGFQFITLADALQASRDRAFPERAVVVTFDDGFENVLTHGLPILQEAQVPATIFVNTAYLGTQAPFPFDSWGCRHHAEAPPQAWRPLTPDQCRELQASGLVTIGAHTHTHEDFRGRAREFRADAQTSIEFVRDWFREEPVLFAFPYGSPHDGFAGGELREAVLQTDAACALTTDTRHVAPGSDPYHWGRFNVFSWDTSATLAAKLDGYYSWAPAVWRRLIGRKEVAASKASNGATYPPQDSKVTPKRLPVRVALLTNFVSPHIAPVLREVARRVECLTVLISTPMEGDRVWDPDWEGLDVRVQRSWSFGNPKRHALGFRLSNYVHFPWDTFSQLARLRPDVIVTSEMGVRSILSTIYARLWSRTPLVLDCSLSEHTEVGVGWFKNWVRHRLARQADAVVSSGTSGQRYVRGLGVAADAVSLFPYVALPVFHSAHEPTPVQAPITKVLCVGQLIERKGVLPFATGLAEWLQNHTERTLELLLAGDGLEKQKLLDREWPRNLHLRFLGHLAGEELRAIYHQADLFAFPTLADEWGLVTDEALWCGLPVLGSIYAQSVLDLVEPGMNGWQYDPLRPGDLQRGLDLALTASPEQLTQMRKAAWRKARERTPEFAADCLLQAVERALSSPSRRAPQ